MSGIVRAKVAMLGSPSVGKTSLVRRFVHSTFSEEYHSTLGVKVDRKTMPIDDSTVTLILWDMHGETEGLDIPRSYLRGVRAGVLVFDASRPETIALTADLRDRLAAESAKATVRLIANKSDLEIDWDVVAAECARLNLPEPMRTSALSGDGVEAMFTSIGHELVRS